MIKTPDRGSLDIRHEWWFLSRLEGIAGEAVEVAHRTDMVTWPHRRGHATQLAGVDDSVPIPSDGRLRVDRPLVLSVPFWRNWPNFPAAP